MNRLTDSINKAVKTIKSTEGLIRIVSHFDADGISAAAIITGGLLRAGKRVHTSVVNQIKPEVVKMLNEEEPELLIFADLGSSYLDELNRLNAKKIIILDHHQIEGSYRGDNLHHINPLLVGMSEDEISGAGISYIMIKNLDPKNIDLSPLAIVGAIGDIQESEGKMNGLNRQILEEGKNSGALKIERGLKLFGRTNRPIHKALEYSTDPFIPGVTNNESGAIQFLSEIGIQLKKDDRWRTISDLNKEEMKKLATAIICERIRNDEPDPEMIFGDVYTFWDGMDAKEFATMLNACGRMKEASIGILACMKENKSSNRMGGILAGYRKMIGNYIKWVRENPETIKKMKYSKFIMAGPHIHENFMGTVTTICIKSNIIETKILGGLADTEDGEIKVSVRAKDELNGIINLKDAILEACEKCGGVGGGHSMAAGAFIPKGAEETFINVFEEIISQQLGETDGKGN